MMKNSNHISPVFKRLHVSLARPLKWTTALIGLFVLFGLFTEQLKAQTIPMDDIREEQIRIQQLLTGSAYSSLTNRPLWQGVYEKTLNQPGYDFGLWTTKLSTEPFGDGNDFPFRFGVYEPTFRITTNSMVPYGDNNEAAWYGRGVNSEFTGGFWVSSDFITVTFRPQFVTHQNRDFETPRFIPVDEDENIIYAAEGIGGIIDNPFRFGSDPFSTFSPGYSSFRLHYKHIEAGYSTEPMGWGGNVNYPLLLSNNAPGMRHFFLGTRAPLRVPYVGSFEFSYIGAFPEDSEYFVWNEDEEQRDRFMNGINITYSPAFATNFHLGFARAVHTYIEPGGLKPEDFGLIFDPFFLEDFTETRGPLHLLKPRNHLNSIYARWIWPQAHFELYGEFYREDFAWDLRDLLMEPRHNSGYAFGFQKLVFAPFANFYKVNLEFTNMTPSFLQEVRAQNYYYTHKEIRQGHTHQGQVLGAGIGPGSNSQFLRVDAYKDWGRYGLFIRRLADNSHFHFQYDRSLQRSGLHKYRFGDYWRNRTDLTIGAKALVRYKNFHLESELSWTKLYNYGRFDYGTFNGLNISNFDPYDITNVQFQVSVSYLF